MSSPLQTRILLLEDDTNLRELIAETPEDVGYGVDSAAEALTAIEAARLGCFDLLLTDVRVAGSMDGAVLYAS